MQLVIQLVVSALVFGVTLSGGSLIWPKVTSNPRPHLLEQVHNFTLGTPVGQQAAQVLGVTDEASVTPINLGEIANNIGNSVKTAAQKRVQTIIMSQVRNQLISKYENLSEDQRHELQQIICKPEDVVK